MIGTIIKDGYQLASANQAGLVKPDGTSITIDADGTIHAKGGGGDIALADVSGASATVVKEVASLTWTDPNDIVIEGVTLAAWAGTKVVRKIGSAPSSYTDGTLIADVTVRNSHASDPLVDNTIEYGNVYYYRFFPYTTHDTYTNGSSVNVTPTREVVSLPVQSGSLTYSGSSQSPSWSGYDTTKMTMGGTTSGTDAGDYNATFTPAHDYMWSDDSTTAKTVVWSIGKADAAVSLSADSVTLDPDHLTATVTVLSSTGTVTVTSASPSDVSVAFANNVITLTAESEDSKTVNVTISIAASSNHNSGTVTLPVTLQFMSSVLDDNTWAAISGASAAGTASSYWAVGDCKKVTLNGAIGEGLTLTNQDFWVFILGFDHNSTVEGSGISFGTFKTAKTNGVDVALCDDVYSTNAGNTGAKKFAMNHWGSGSNPYNTNYGGWKGCDLRYDILGSTDSAPSGYGSMPQTNRTGVDASSTTATSPVANTLMAALPSDLRATMKPITKYTDNTGNSSNVQANVTASIDYLPLLAEYEVQGTRTYANQYEQGSQAQYSYYSNSNSKIKYNHSSTSSAVRWWLRSPYYSGANYFCYVYTDGSAYSTNSGYSRGVGVAFLV